MLNKPLKIKKIVMLLVAQIFCLSCLSLYAQNEQSSSPQPETKKVQNSKPKISLSNTEVKPNVADEAAAAKLAKQENLRKEQAAEAKKQAMLKENEKKASKSATVSTSNVNTNANKASTTNQAAKTKDIQKDWEGKKAKLTADMKAKGFTQYDIDKHLAEMEKQMNINNNSNK